MIEPQFKHDCERCEFLGQISNHDIYRCDQGTMMPTIVVRYSDEGPDYFSNKTIKIVATTNGFEFQ